MKPSFSRLALLAVLAASPAVMAQQKPATAAVAQTKVKPTEVIVPELSLNEIPLADVVDYLRDTVPGFKVMVVRTGPATSDPLITLRLKGVSLGQVLELLTTAYPIEISKVPAVAAADSEVTIIRVKGAPADAAGAAIVRVYHLSAITGQLRSAGPVGSTTFDPAAIKPEDVEKLSPDGQAAWRKWKAEQDKHPGQNGALNEVLSLVKATLAQVDGPPPVLQVHEGTETLIFKGTPAQRAALEDALISLDPNPNTLGGATVVRERNDKQITDLQRQLVEKENERAKESQLYDERLVDVRHKAAEEERMWRAEQSDARAQAQELEKTKIRLEAALEELAKTKARFEAIEAQNHATSRPKE